MELFFVSQAQNVLTKFPTPNALQTIHIYTDGKSENRNGTRAKSSPAKVGLLRFGGWLNPTPDPVLLHGHGLWPGKSWLLGKTVESKLEWTAQHFWGKLRYSIVENIWFAPGTAFLKCGRSFIFLARKWSLIRHVCKLPSVLVASLFSHWWIRTPTLPRSWTRPWSQWFSVLYICLVCAFGANLQGTVIPGWADVALAHGSLHPLLLPRHLRRSAAHTLHPQVFHGIQNCVRKYGTVWETLNCGNSTRIASSFSKKEISQSGVFFVRLLFRTFASWKQTLPCCFVARVPWSSCRMAKVILLCIRQSGLFRPTATTPDPKGENCNALSPPPMVWLHCLEYFHVISCFSLHHKWMKLCDEGLLLGGNSSWGFLNTKLPMLTYFSAKQIFHTLSPPPLQFHEHTKCPNSTRTRQSMRNFSGKEKTYWYTR